MTMWKCDVCGLEKKASREQLVDEGWAMSQVWYGKPRVYFKVMVCPPHRNQLHSEIDANVTRIDLKLREEKKKN